MGYTIEVQHITRCTSSFAKYQSDSLWRLPDDKWKSNIRELAENILIFVPFGIYGGMLARERAGGTVILAGAGFSLFLETLQYLLAMGASDITDVINNTLGAVIGVLLWKAFRKIAGEKSWLIVQILATVGTVGMLGVSVLICITNA